MAEKTIPISGAKGIDNRSDETKVAPGYVREAVNVDLTSNGVMQRRTGCRKIFSTAIGHSLWSHPECPFALFADGGTLKALWSDLSATTVKTGLQPRDLYYEFLNGRVFYSNGVDNGCVFLDGSSSTWGVERPSNSYTAAPTDTGGLHAGTYQIALTFGDMSREESGAMESQYVDVVEGGGIDLTQLPAPLSSTVTVLRVYISQANGETLFWNCDLPPGMPTAKISLGQRGKPLSTQFMATMPPGKYLRKYNGRMLLADGKYLFFSESLRYGLYHETKGYIKFGEPITAILAPDAEGTQLYIGTTTKTYLYRGGTMDSGSMTIVDHNGIVPGSGVMIPTDLMGFEGVNKTLPFWMSSNGVFYIGTESGPLAVKRDKLASNIPGKAASMYMERDGLQQMIMSYYGGRQNRLSMGDRAIATVYDKSGPGC